LLFSVASTAGSHVDGSKLSKFVSTPLWLSVAISEDFLVVLVAVAAFVEDAVDRGSEQRREEKAWPR